MRKAVLNTEKCKSCEICVRACTQNALRITERLNGMGYRHVGIDETKCVGCGTCYIVCPDCVFTIVEED